MEHNEYIRIIEDSDVAVLMIHGILGTPRHFDALLPLIPADWSVYNILLDGHGGTVRDFNHTSMKKWRSQVTGMVQRLSRQYERIVIVAHSMGTLLSMDAALQGNHRIAAMIFLASPVRIFVKPSAPLNALKAIFGLVRPDDVYAKATDAAHSVMLNRRLWQYIGMIPRFLELLAISREMRNKLPELTVPVHAFQSRYDELVSIRSVEVLKRCPAACVRILERSRHYYYETTDLAYLKYEISHILKELGGENDLL